MVEACHATRPSLSRLRSMRVAKFSESKSARELTLDPFLPRYELGDAEAAQRFRRGLVFDLRAALDDLDLARQRQCALTRA